MKEKTTKELLKSIRDNQTKLSSSMFIEMSNKAIDNIYDEIFEAEKIILERTKF